MCRTVPRSPHRTGLLDFDCGAYFSHCVDDVSEDGTVVFMHLDPYRAFASKRECIEQLSGKERTGPVSSTDGKVVPPKRGEMKRSMEALIHHFKLVMEGPRPPAGESYVAVESPKGEKGYYFVSDGTAKPVRWRIRPPSFLNLAVLPRLCEGALLSDVIAINASVDIVMGEIDR